jgi:hypothetical protein
MKRELFRKVLDHIKAKGIPPNTSDTVNFAAVTCELCGFNERYPESIRWTAKEYLWLGQDSVGERAIWWLIDPRRTIADFEAFYEANGIPHEQT